MNFKDRIFKSSVYGLLGHTLRIAIAFMLTPFLMRSLGEESYGLWLLILAALGWFKFVSSGFSSAVQRNIAIALEANDTQKINSIFSCSVVLFGTLGLISGSLLFAFSYFPHLLGVGEQYFQVVHVAFMVFSLKILWDLGMCSFHGFYSGLIRYDIDANIDMVNEVCKAVLIVLLVQNWNIYGAIFATMVSDFITNILKIIYAKKLFPGFKFDSKLISRDEFKKLYDYSKHVFAITLADGFNVTVDALIISHLLGLKFVAIYGVAARLVGFAETAFLVVLNTFLPVFTRLIERKGDIRPELEQVFSLNIFLVAIFITPLMMFSDFFFYLWLGEGFEETHIIVMAIAISASCRAISRPVTQLFLAKAQHQALTYVKLFGVVVNVVLSIILGTYYGLVGIAAATIISFYLSDACLHLLIYKHYTQHPIAHLAFTFIRSNVLVLGISYSGYYLLQGVDRLSWLELFVAGGLTFAGSIVIFWFAALNQGAKAKITEVIEARLPEDSFIKKLLN